MAKDRREVVLPKMPRELADPIPAYPPLSKQDAQEARWDLCPFVIVDQDTSRIVVANRPAEDLFGYDRGELYGVSVHSLVPVAVRGRHADHVARFAAEPYQTVRPMGQGLTVEGQHRAGRVFPVNVALYRFLQGGRRYILAEIVDMRTGVPGHPADPHPSWSGTGLRPPPDPESVV